MGSQVNRNARRGPNTSQGGARPEQIDVVVVDDHDVVRIALAAVVRNNPDLGIRLVGQARSAEELRVVARANPCDVVMLDLALGDESDPADTVAWLLGLNRRILIYSVSDNPQLIRRALAAGAHGLSRKSDPIARTITTIREVASGHTPISHDVLTMIDGDDAFVEVSLSRRERDVLTLYVSGLDVPELSRQLFITENSAKEYLRRIRTKYSTLARPALSKVDLLRRAIEDGIVPPIVPR